jgi:hypothetical protein
MIRFSSRLVFILPKVVIKIPIDKRGYLQGKNESKLYNKYKHTKLLGELISEFCGVVIMKRYKPLSSKLNKHEVNKVKQTISELNIKNCDLYNQDNWGEGHILIDYGINEHISKLYCLDY